MGLRRGSWWITLAVAAIVAAIHVRAWIANPNPINPDSDSYIEPASHLLLDGELASRDRVAYAVPPGSFSAGPVKPETIRTPVYPLVIAAFTAIGASLRTLTLFQHLLVVLAAAAIQRLLLRFAGDAASAGGALLFGLHPAVVETSGVVMTETLAAVVVAAAVVVLYAAMKRSSSAIAAIAGLLFGIAALTRPIAVYLPFVLIVMMLLRRIPRRLVVAFAISSLLLPFAWVVRNYERSGVATISSIGGENLLLYRAAGALVVAGDPLDGVFALQKQFGFYRQALAIRVPLVKQALSLAEAAGVKPENHAERSRYFARLGATILARHPLAYAGVAVSAVIALLVDDLATIAAMHGAHIDEARLLLVPLSLLALLCAGAGLRRLFATERDAAFLLSAVLAYFVVLSAGPEVEPRFIVPYLPLYAVAAGIGADAIVRRLSARWRMRAAGVASRRAAQR